MYLNRQSDPGNCRDTVRVWVRLTLLASLILSFAFHRDLPAQEDASDGESEFLIVVHDGRLVRISPYGTVSRASADALYEGGFDPRVFPDGRVLLKRRREFFRFARVSGHSVIGPDDFGPVSLNLPVTRHREFVATARNTILSPDGRWLATRGSGPPLPLVAAEGNEPVSQIMILDLETGESRTILRIPEWTPGIESSSSWLGYGPSSSSWSPDGTRIAFYYALNPDNPIRMFGLAVVSVENGTVTILAEPRRWGLVYGYDAGSGPIWSPDSTTVYFAGNYELVEEQLKRPHTDPRWPGEAQHAHTYSVSAEGGEWKAVAIGNPMSITPDGRYLYCSSPWWGNGGAELAVRVNLKTGEQRFLGHEWMEAMVSPSGKYIVTFVKPTKERDEEILFYDADGPFVPRTVPIARVKVRDHTELPRGSGDRLRRSSYWVKLSE